MNRRAAERRWRRWLLEETGRRVVRGLVPRHEHARLLALGDVATEMTRQHTERCGAEAAERRVWRWAWGRYPTR